MGFRNAAAGSEQRLSWIKEERLHVCTSRAVAHAPIIAEAVECFSAAVLGIVGRRLTNEHLIGREATV
jgi:hypothetical protein